MMQNEAHFQLEESARKKPSALDFLLGDDSNNLEYMSPALLSSNGIFLNYRLAEMKIL